MDVPNVVAGRSSLRNHVADFSLDGDGGHGHPQPLFFARSGQAHELGRRHDGVWERMPRAAFVEQGPAVTIEGHAAGQTNDA